LDKFGEGPNNPIEIDVVFAASYFRETDPIEAGVGPEQGRFQEAILSHLSFGPFAKLKVTWAGQASVAATAIAL
jgi:hypothetical protein